MIRMPLKNTRIYLTILFAIFTQTNAFALEDMPGSADHPKLNRISGTHIVAYDKSDYGEHEFLIGYENRKPVATFREGKLTRLVYALKEGQTDVFAMRNYQEALGELGEVNTLYACRERECPSNIGKRFIWGESKRFPSSIKSIDTMYSVASYHLGSRYWSGEVTSDTANYTISLYSASAAHPSRNHKNAAQAEGLYIGQAFLHVDIIEKSTFKSDLTVVEASEIQESIASKGHIALYGLFFDTGKDQLTAQSQPALAEIAKALNADKSLNLYVVGHTDNVGSLQSNQALSERRAASIIKSLTAEYNIQSSRLIAIGVGLAAPVASNDTEEGRGLNRRVELVKR